MLTEFVRPAQCLPSNIKLYFVAISAFKGVRHVSIRAKDAMLASQQPLADRTAFCRLSSRSAALRSTRRTQLFSLYMIICGAGILGQPELRQAYGMYMEGVGAGACARARARARTHHCPSHASR